MDFPTIDLLNARQQQFCCWLRCCLLLQRIKKNDTRNLQRLQFSGPYAHNTTHKQLTMAHTRKRKADNADSALQQAMDTLLTQYEHKYKKRYKRNLGDNIAVAKTHQWGEGLFLKATHPPIMPNELIAGYGGTHTPAEIAHTLPPHQLSHTVTLSRFATCNAKHYNTNIAHMAAKANTHPNPKKNNAKLTVKYNKIGTAAVTMHATKIITPGQQIFCKYKIWPDGENYTCHNKDAKQKIIETHKRLKMARIWAHNTEKGQFKIVKHTCTHGEDKEEQCTCAAKHQDTLKWIRIKQATQRTAKNQEAGDGCFIHTPSLKLWDTANQKDIIVLTACNTNCITNENMKSSLHKHYNITIKGTTKIAPRTEAHMPAIFKCNELHPDTERAAKNNLHDMMILAKQGIIPGFLDIVDGVPCIKVSKHTLEIYTALGKPWAELRFAYDTVTHTFGGNKLLKEQQKLTKENLHAPNNLKPGQKVPRRLKRKRTKQHALAEISYITKDGKHTTIERQCPRIHNLAARAGLFITQNPGTTMINAHKVTGKTYAEVAAGKNHIVAVTMQNGKLTCIAGNTTQLTEQSICQIAFETTKMPDLRAFAFD